MLIKYDVNDWLQLRKNRSADSVVKVVQKIGLCIGFYDLLESSDGLIGHGTGLVNVNGMFICAVLCI